MAGGW
ncbi:anti-sigma-28 factor, FlgM family protein, partial [Vibrio cholerae HC-39A1]